MCPIGERELRPAQTALDSTSSERNLSSMDAERYRKPTKARPVRPRLRGAACRRPRRLLGRDRLCSVGSCRSRADEARRHAGSRTSGNWPDTAERAPLDARGWVPSVFRARPAHRNVSCSRLPLASVFSFFFSSPCRHRGVKGQKVKVGAKAGRRRVAAAKAAPR